MTPEEVRKILDRIKHSRYDLERVYGILLSVMHDGKEPAPMLEIITVIKYEMPELFDLLKLRSSVRPGMKMLFDLSMDYNQAKKQLGI